MRFEAPKPEARRAAAALSAQQGIAGMGGQTNMARQATPAMMRTLRTLLVAGCSARADRHAQAGCSSHDMSKQDAGHWRLAARRGLFCYALAVAGTGIAGVGGQTNTPRQAALAMIRLPSMGCFAAQLLCNRCGRVPTAWAAREDRREEGRGHGRRPAGVLEPAAGRANHQGSVGRSPRCFYSRSGRQGRAGKSARNRAPEPRARPLGEAGWLPNSDYCAKLGLGQPVLPAPFSDPDARPSPPSCSSPFTLRARPPSTTTKPVAYSNTTCNHGAQEERRRD